MSESTGKSTGSEGAFERAPGQKGADALEKEARLPLTGWQQEVDKATAGA